MGDKVSVVVEVPGGKYCAVKAEFGLHERCPLLHSCGTQEGAHYCAVVSSDAHLREDNCGVLKHDYAYYVCPSLLEDKLMELCRLKSSSEVGELVVR